MAMAAEDARPPSLGPALHVLIIPFPLQGHINIMFPFARLLVSRGVTVTFVVNHHTLHRSLGPSPDSRKQEQFPAGLRLVGVDDGLPPDANRDMGICFPGSDYILGMRPGVEELLIQLGKDDDVPVTCMIADTFVTWAHDVASKFGIPRVVFHTTCAHACCVSYFVPSLVAKGLIPFKGNGLEYDPDFVIDCIPGVPPIHPIDFPYSSRYRYQFTIDQFRNTDKAAGVVLNTFYELESKTIDALQKEFSVYPVGFLLLYGIEWQSVSRSVSYWPEDDKCLPWLCSQPTSSVLYISFGSLATLSAEQNKELAQGLENSEVRFLWANRPGGVQGTLSEIFPDGFTDRTKDRGLIISWAPQLQVLSHPSVGGFLTHGGWNSITENLCVGGVPMICWPQIAEQRLNCRLLVDEWKIGMEFQSSKIDTIDKREVEKVVRALMQGEDGGMMRRRAAQFKDAARRAVQKGGSSHRYLEAFMETIKKAAERSIVKNSSLKDQGE
eukprot:c25847_g1_i2 orf=107-1594(+)